MGAVVVFGAACSILRMTIKLSFALEDKTASLVCFEFRAL